MRLFHRFNALASIRKSKVESILHLLGLDRQTQAKSKTRI